MLTLCLFSLNAWHFFKDQVLSTHCGQQYVFSFHLTWSGILELGRANRLVFLPSLACDSCALQKYVAAPPTPRPALLFSPQQKLTRGLWISVPALAFPPLALLYWFEGRTPVFGECGVKCVSKYAHLEPM